MQNYRRFGRYYPDLYPAVLSLCW